jgi:hypothetical protein
MDDLENMLNEISQIQKDKQCMMYYVWNLKKTELIKAERTVATRSHGWRKQGTKFHLCRMNE